MLCRGADVTSASEPYRWWELRIDYAERSVIVARTEVQLLRRHSTAKGVVPTYDQLLRSEWSRERSGDSYLVRNVVKRLRQKLAESGETRRTSSRNPGGLPHTPK